MTERTEETIKEVTYDSMNIAFIRKTYEKVFNIGDKEASSSAALVPFLTGAVDMLSELTKKKYVFDPSFCVYESRSKGTNPATDFAIVSFM